jgi:hypothetical protein
VKKLPNNLTANRYLSIKSIIFVIVFISIGAFFVFHSFAATPIVASIQAENMALPSGATVISDSSASGGKAVQMTQGQSSLTGKINLPTAATSFGVTARAGGTCASVEMKASIDGITYIKETRVKGTSYSTISTGAINLNAGSHTLSIKLDNPNNLCKHQLIVDVTNFYGPVVPPPTPTVTISATPVSIASGQSSTLNWSSTNVTSCTASGAWSGTKQLSGTQSTGALNASSLYTLSCTGAGGSATQTAAVTVNTSGGGGAQPSNCLQLQSGSTNPVYSALDNCNYPSPDTTGVTPGTSLTTVSNTAANFYGPNTQWNASNGEFSISGSTNLSNLYIPGWIYINASSGSNIVITNSKIQSNDADALNDALVFVQGSGNISISNSQISGVYTGSKCTGPGNDGLLNDSSSANVSLNKDYLSCAGEPLNGNNNTIKNSYIIVDGYIPGAHVEDIYINAGENGDIENNTLLNPANQTAVIFGDAKNGGLNNVTVKNNLLATDGTNGDIGAGCEASKSLIIENNRFSSIYIPSGSSLIAGNTTNTAGTTWSGNYLDNNPSTTVPQPVTSC